MHESKAAHILVIIKYYTPYNESSKIVKPFEIQMGDVLYPWGDLNDLH